MSDEMDKIVTEIYDNLHNPDINCGARQVWLKRFLSQLIQQKPKIDRIERMLKWLIIRFVEGGNEAPYAEISDVLKEIK